MNKVTFWNNGHETGRPIRGRRQGDETEAETLETLPVYITTERLEVQTLLAPASRFSLMTARLLAALKPKPNKQAIKQEKEALSTWEDEGGTPAARKPDSATTTK